MGAATTHFGIRYANDPTDEFSEYIVDSVDLLNLQLAPHGVGFFFDAVDVSNPLAASTAFLAILTLEIKRKVTGPMMHSAELSKSLIREESK